MIKSLQVRFPAGPGGEFYSPEQSFCADSYSVSVLLQKHAKDLGHSAKSAGGRFTPKRVHTIDPTQYKWADCAIQA